MTARTAQRSKQRRLSGELVVAALVGLVVAAWLGHLALQHPVFTAAAALVMTAAAVLLARHKLHLRRRARNRVHALSDILRLDPTSFEYFTADLMRRDGCKKVERVGGADLAADNLGFLPDGRRFLLQAKFYALGTKVGSEDVQQVGGTYDKIHGAQVAIVVTTSHFTKAALAYCRRVGIHTCDREQLAAWASRTGPAPWRQRG